MNRNRIAAGRQARWCAGIFSAVLASIASDAAAQQDESLWTRDALTGGWGGTRDALARHGVTARFEVTGFYQGMFSGSGNDDFEPAMRVDALLDFDSGRLGLWQGGGLHVHLEYVDDTLPGFRGGALWPVNSGTVLPLGSANELIATSLYLRQKLGDATSLLVGKINADDLLAGDPFFGGWGTHRFWNLAFVAPPSGVVPPVIMGTLLSHAAGPYKLTAMVFDPDDQTANYSFNDLFDDGVNIQLSGAWTGQVDGRTTTLGLTGTYSTKDGADLSRIVLPPDLQTGTKEGSYYAGLQFGHLLIESPVLAGRGLGVYGRVGIADGNPNPIRAHVTGGLAGHSIVPSRPRDSFGIGYFFYKFSDDLQDAVNPLVSFGDEQGLELWYNFAVTPWLRLGADLQVIDPASADNEWAVIGGLRVNVVF